MDGSDSVPLQDWYLITYLVLIVLLLFLSALISGSEVAFFQIKEKPQSKEKDKLPKKITRLLKKPEQLLATILVANNFINISIVILATYITAILLKNVNETARFIVDVVLITAVILFFGEIVPKVFATRNDLAFAKKTAPLLIFFEKIFFVLIRPMVAITKKFSNKLQSENQFFSKEDLSKVLELTESEASQNEKRILSGILQFGDTEAKQIMKPRLDVFALSDEEKFEDIIPKIQQHGYSRIPVYHENMDQIKGILFVKDLLPYLDKKDDFDWRALIKPAFFVPENIKLDDLLKEFQKKRTHLAIVVDEYGGTSGIITLEDVIEEVLGEEITDEHDKESNLFKKLNKNTYIFKGKVPLKDFYKILDLPEDVVEKFEYAKGPSESLAGFFLERNGVFPREKDRIYFEGFELIANKIDKNRIDEVKIIKPGL